MYTLKSMDNQSVKIGLKYGAITGALISLYALAEYLLGFHTTKLHIGEYTGYGSVIIPFTTSFLTLWTIKKTNKGMEKKKMLVEGIKASGVNTLATAAIVSAFFYLYNSVINPKWMDLAYEYQLQKLIDSGIASEVAQAHMEQFLNFYEVNNQVIVTFFATLTQGAVIFACYILIMYQFCCNSKSKKS